MGRFLGGHAVYDLEFPVNSSILKGGSKFMDLAEKACLDEGAEVVKKYKKKFDGGGFTFTIVLAESHASCHTWPEHGLATVDIFMCGKCNPFSAMETLVSLLKEANHTPTKYHQTKLYRGWVNDNIQTTPSDV